MNASALNSFVLCSGYALWLASLWIIEINNATTCRSLHRGHVHYSLVSSLVCCNWNYRCAAVIHTCSLTCLYKVHCWQSTQVEGFCCSVCFERTFEWWGIKTHTRKVPRIEINESLWHCRSCYILQVIHIHCRCGGDPSPMTVALVIHWPVSWSASIHLTEQTLANSMCK